MLLPHIALLPAPIRAILPRAGGGFAVLTANAIELLDANLAQAGSIECGDARGTELVALADGRYLLHERSWSCLYEAVPGGRLAQVDLAGALCKQVVVTPAGYVALTTDHLIIDRGGDRTLVALPHRTAHGIAAWRAGVVVTGHDGLAVLDATGEVLATRDLPLSQRPVGFGRSIAAPGREAIAIFDDNLDLVASIPERVESDALTGFGAGVLVTVCDDPTPTVTYWEPRGSRYEDVWSFASDAGLQPPVVIGERIVLATWDGPGWIVDAVGHPLAQLDGPIRDACAFAGGIAVRAANCSELAWWRPDHGLAYLAHDVEPALARAVPAGLASAEANVLYLWRADVPGPAAPPPSPSDLPLATPIVAGGRRLTVEAPGRFLLRAVDDGGRRVGIARGSPWRPATTRAEATALVETLIQRRFEDELPALAAELPRHERSAHLAQLPLAQTAALHGRAMFAASTLEPDVRERAGWARQAFFAELGAALGVSARVLAAAVRARKLCLEPPRPVPGYDYLGSFTSSGDLTVGDPCYAGKQAPAGVVMALSIKVAAHDGVWHVFLRSGTGGDADRTAELVTMHDTGFDVFATERLALIGVDSGTAGVFDQACPRRDGDTPVEEGVFAGLGALAWSGHGDGTYPVFAGNAKGRVAKLRIAFLGDQPELDRSIAVRPSKRYAASATFAAGDTIEHVKFGSGSVLRVSGDGKIDVRFADGVRTLVHARR